MKQVWALVPVKDFTCAKSRLASTLSTEDRHALARAMTQDVITALKHSRTVARVLMVSDIPTLDRQLGIDAIEHFDTRRARGLNEDLEAAADWATTQGATHILVVHADLPRLTPQAIDRFVAGNGERPAAQMRAAACKQGSGTNLLLSPLPLPLPLVFGRNSLPRFCRMAAAADVPIDVIHDAALAADIDEPDDLRALILAYGRGELAGRATADFLLAATAARSARRSPAAEDAFGDKAVVPRSKMKPMQKPTQIKRSAHLQSIQ